MDIKEFMEEWENNSEFMQVKTSGSTGTPKKMMVRKSSMLASARRTNDFFGLKKGDRTLLCMSLDYVAGKMMAVRSIERGLQMDVVEPSGHPLADVTCSYDFIAMVPMQVWNTLQNDEERARLSATRHLLIGGGEISSALEDALQSLPCCSWSSYGMTETLSHVAVRKIGGMRNEEGGGCFEGGKRKDEGGRRNVESAGWYEPLDGVRLSVAEDGCLVVNDDVIGAFDLKTNDIAEFNSDGRRFRILGRKDNVICSGGIKIQAEEVERILAKEFVLPFMITKRKDEKFGEAVVMAIETDDPSAINEARKACQSLLPKFWQPRYYVIMKELPRTETGKVRRVECLLVER